MDKYYKAEDVERVLSVYLERSYVLEGIEWLSKRAIEASEDCIDKYSALAELDPRSYEYKAVRELPSVIPQAKEGEWIISADGESSCSVCGASEEEFIYGTENWYGMGESKFCPACGAKTRG